MSLPQSPTISALSHQNPYSYYGLEGRELLEKVLEIYDQGTVANVLKSVDNKWCRETLNRTIKGKADTSLSWDGAQALIKLLPQKPEHYGKADFTFIDLFAGIGGIRKGFDAVKGECVFTSEWDKFAVRTYKANHYCDPVTHRFNRDIRDITLSENLDIDEDTAYKNIDREIPGSRCSTSRFSVSAFLSGGRFQEKLVGPQAWVRVRCSRNIVL